MSEFIEETDKTKAVDTSKFSKKLAQKIIGTRKKSNWCLDNIVHYSL